MGLAIGYIRVSGYPQLSTHRIYKHSFRRQAEAINQQAIRNGDEVIQFFFDCIKGETLFSKRPGGLMVINYLKMLKDNGLTANVFVEDMSRFARSVSVINDPDLNFFPASSSKLEEFIFGQ